MVRTLPIKRVRGRPPKDRIGNFIEGGPPTIALEVLNLEFAFRQQGVGRGALMKAVRQVAKNRGYPEATIKRYVARYRKALERSEDGVPGLVDGLYRTSRAVNEIERRLSGIPSDVLDKCAGLPSSRFLKLLRAAGADGTCPDWLVWAVRGWDGGDPKGLMVLLENCLESRAK